MKKTLLLGGMVAATLAAAGIATAQTATQTAAQTPTETSAPAAMRQLRGDTDNDGRLSRAEFVEGRIARLTAQDANGDGSVSREEMQAAGQARRAERADARFAKLDADGNGAISRAEFDAGHAARPDRGPRAERAGHHGRRGGARHAMRGAEGARERGPVVIAEVRQKLDESFARMDADKDGHVTADERRTSMRQLREARRERMTQRRAVPAPATVPAATSE